MKPAEDVAREWLVRAGVSPEGGESLLRRLTAALIERERAPWQPIETAPKDGTLIDLLYPYPRGRAISCMWGDGSGFGPEWFWREPRWDGGVLLPEDQWSVSSYPNMEPTHWMPAPKPPEGA